MPVIGIPIHTLIRLLGQDLDRKELSTHLMRLGCDLEGFQILSQFKCTRCGNIYEITETENPPVECGRCGVDYHKFPEESVQMDDVEVIRMELLAVRPDMFDPGGLARTLRGYLGLSEPVRYPLAPPQVSVQVEDRLSHPESSRPAISCAVVRQVTCEDEFIKLVMKLQENLHWALGRNRKHASIGVYDLDKVQPDFKYRTLDPRGRRFIPLGLPGQEMSGQQILEEHPKGKAFAQLLEHFSAYPLLEDREGQILSMPPIINSEATKVTSGTRNFFIDVTGTSERITAKALNVLTTSLLELDPRVVVEQVEIHYPDHRVITPDLTPQKMDIDAGKTGRLLGLSLSRQDVIQLLIRMGHEVLDRGEGPLTVSVPAYRNDILHERDLMEDVAIAYGYHRVPPTKVPTMTVGRPLAVQEISNTARQVFTGLGYQEIMTLILTSPENSFTKLRLPYPEEVVVEISNPISIEQTIMRRHLLTGMLETFSRNANRELPQRIFEAGDITVLDSKGETGAREIRKVAAGIIDPHVGYADIRAVAEALLREFDWALEVQDVDWGLFLPGRAATIIAAKEKEMVPVGAMGELHPEVLEAFKLVHPAAVLEIDIQALSKAVQAIS